MSSFGVDLRVAGLEEAYRKVKNLSKQTRFATSLAINRTLLNVQKWTLDELLPGVFVLRSRGKPWQTPGTKYGFNIRFSNKKRLEGVLGSQADWLGLQERGGIKKVAGHRLAIPTEFWKPPKDIIRRRKKPKRILGGRKVQGLVGKPFIYEAGTSQNTAMPSGIYARLGKSRLPIKMLFYFVESVNIRERLRFESMATLRAKSTFPYEFQRAFVNAVLTAK